MLFLPLFDDAFGLTGSDLNLRAHVETVRTIPGDAEGTFEHFVKICAGENNRYPNQWDLINKIDDYGSNGD